MKAKIVYNYEIDDLIDTTVFDLGYESLIPDSFSSVKISFTFLDDEGLLEINKKFLNHDYYTDIITFDYCVGKRLAGEIFISLDRVRDNAVSGFDNELLRVMSHGLLHLLGYKDKSDSEKKEMRVMEDLWINKLVSRES